MPKPDHLLPKKGPELLKACFEAALFKARFLITGLLDHSYGPNPL
ncbi:hypothetical protein KIS4809_2054 [Bacillus sp. ZZV12-4809]|nr:hypothetical protein KIS4809_2054 [Bacillus sp. ZZV12-4809]